MKLNKFEELSSLIFANNDSLLNLSNLEIYDSIIIDLLPALAKKNSLLTLDLSHNHLTNFSTMMLISSLKNIEVLNICYNHLSDDFEIKLQATVWHHNMRIHFTVRDGNGAKELELANCTKKNVQDYNSLYQHFNEYVELFSQNHNMASARMVNFLLGCIPFWDVSQIKKQILDHVVHRKTVPNDFIINKKLQEIKNVLNIAIDYARDVDRLIRVYKSHYKETSNAEELLLNEFCILLKSIEETDLQESLIYSSYHLYCDVFDFFIYRFNAEIDNSAFYATSVAWSRFLDDIRRFLIDHIQLDVQKIAALREVKGRNIFTLHRHKGFRLLSWFSPFLAGRTQAIREIDNTLAETEAENPPGNLVQLAWRNACSIHEWLYNFYHPKPIGEFVQILSAIRLHNHTVVAQLLQKSQNSYLLDLDGDGWSLIHHWAATAKLDADIFQLLLGEGNVNYVIENSGWNAIFVVVANSTASALDKCEKIKLLLMNRVNAMEQDKLSGKLALHYAIESGQLDVTECLCRHNLEMLKIKDRFEKTPLEYAVAGSIMATLLEDLEVQLEPVITMIEVESLIVAL